MSMQTLVQQYQTIVRMSESLQNIGTVQDRTHRIFFPRPLTFPLRCAVAHRTEQRGCAR